MSSPLDRASEPALAARTIPVQSVCSPTLLDLEPLRLHACLIGDKQSAPDIPRTAGRIDARETYPGVGTLGLQDEHHHREPATAQISRQGQPAGPAPTMATSAIFGFRRFGLREMKRCTGNADIAMTDDGL